MAMELDNSFTVPVPPDVAWSVLLDVARIAPCMPGATVDEVDGEVVNGRIKVKVGPVSLTYKGTANFTERDESARKVSVEASGKETRGAGTASAVVTASLSPAEGDSTLVTMHTTMNVTGRPAQFGRGVMVEVGGKLVEKFAENLALQLTADGAAASADAAADGAAAGDEAASADADGAAAGDGAADGAASAGPADEAAGSGTGTADSGTAEADQSGPASEGAATETASVVTPPPAPAQEDSLNLVRLVGPAILKRVLPVAAIIAAVALLGRRIRRGLRRAKQ
jgi:carbon monoxide dehydrogenase subunit G